MLLLVVMVLLLLLMVVTVEVIIVTTSLMLLVVIVVPVLLLSTAIVLLLTRGWRWLRGAAARGFSPSREGEGAVAADGAAAGAAAGAGEDDDLFAAGVPAAPAAAKLVGFGAVGLIAAPPALAAAESVDCGRGADSSQ